MSTDKTYYEMASGVLGDCNVEDYPQVLATLSIVEAIKEQTEQLKLVVKELRSLNQFGISIIKGDS
jgi:hypothetical protein